MTQNKIALVTGGSRGLGKDMAFSLARKGLDVILTYNSQKAEAESVVAGIKQLGQEAVALKLDVGEIESYLTFFTEVRNALSRTFNAEKFDFLINNAGMGIHAPFANTTVEQFDSLVNVHFKAAFFLTQSALPLLADGGGVVNISSGLARFSTPGYSAYASMKGTVETLSKYQAKELGERKIRVNVVAPGAIETDFGGGGLRDNEEINKSIASITALRPRRLTRRHRRRGCLSVHRRGKVDKRSTNRSLRGRDAVNLEESANETRTDLKASLSLSDVFKFSTRN